MHTYIIVNQELIGEGETFDAVAAAKAGSHEHATFSASCRGHAFSESWAIDKTNEYLVLEGVVVEEIHN